MPQQRRRTEPGPGEHALVRACGLGAAHEADLDAFVHVHGDGLSDQEAAGTQQFAHAGQEGVGVAADAEVAVEKQDAVPAALAGQWFEHGAPQRLAA
ncbi:hypothetical protein, partial [Streptomyces caniscabiei]|uniref:hypothetical protein n=1 Tax=Streptomyces caniscabiei TaxID=2746961 RepID=UPI0015C4EF60